MTIEDNYDKFKEQHKLCSLLRDSEYNYSLIYDDELKFLNNLDDLDKETLKWKNCIFKDWKNTNIIKIDKLILESDNISEDWMN